MFKFKKNTGKEYEELIKYVYEELSHYSGKDIKIQKDIKILGKSGCKHQIDVYYEFEINGITHKVVIECKDHKNRVEKQLIEAFKGTLDDIGGCIGIFASRNGFQKGALDFAKYYNIELVSGGELPLIGKVVQKKLEVMLPNSNVIGEPFWTIMEEQEGKVTGSYMLVSNNTVGLFVSKKTAEEMSSKIGGVVRGVSQKHLKIIIGLSEKFNLNLCVFFIDSNQGLVIEYRAVEEYFLI